MAPTSLENRLALATGLWRAAIGGPLPKIPPGEPATQIEQLELIVVDTVCKEANAENAREAAVQTWDLVHDRPDDDPVKQRVAECHDHLAKLSAGRIPTKGELD